MSGDVTGPRWVGGVNAPASGGGDYEALVKESRKFVDLRGIRQSTLLMDRLADAVEALAAERDALRAQLDGMTVEWADAEAGRPDLISHGGVGRERVEDRVRTWNRQMPVLRGDIPKSVAFRRLVSPWAAVEEGDDQ